MQVDVEQSVEVASDLAEGDGCFAPSSPCGDKPYLIVDNSDLPATAHELRDILARSGNLFDRDGPVQVVPSRDGGPPIARRMTPSRIVREAHRLSRPVKLVGEQPVPITLPISVARMYLEMEGEWNLPTLAGICTAPLLSAELLGAVLTIWRFGRQHAAELERGRPLGFEDWAEWCRDPLLALGCCDPVERINRIKADDPHRREIVELFETWHAHHGEKATTAANLAKPVRALIDPHGRGRQHIAARLSRLAGTCAGGFALTRQEAAGKWGASTYALRRS